ncbi:MAG TPA: hypothetical protein VNM45_04980 [Bacillus sp. (in: firmicutes)]|nr:hypothetical protein [Bacillus sp. (in: firmicutes)]
MFILSWNGENGYGIQVYTMATMSLLKDVQELPELFMKSKEATTIYSGEKYIRFFKRSAGAV